MTQSDQSIELGDVFYLRCTLCNPPKPKFFVVAQVTPLRMFLINSDLTDWAKGQQDHVVASPLIQQCQHSFLTYDSYLSCTEVSHEYNLEQLQQKVSQDPSIKRGSLHADARKAVFQALKANVLIARKYLGPIRELWAQYE
ncbi:MAG: hypothetical protein QM601_06250 [Pseudoxanthomonas sp.]